MMQWKEEITRHTEPGAVSVFVFHEKRTGVTAQQLAEHDVVLTTYPVVEAEWRKIIARAPSVPAFALFPPAHPTQSNCKPPLLRSIYGLSKPITNDALSTAGVLLYISLQCNVAEDRGLFRLAALPLGREPLCNRHKVPCQYCGRKFLRRRLVVHQKFFCGPDAVRSLRLQKTEKKRKRAMAKGMRTLRITKGSGDLVGAAALDEGL